ncbi:hypothetical protein GALMADRAFT_219029 [Galerina marginata CBS 339.88]|uniref:Uncharacterized protein n=1 Tax=Galerina marginata (strain CBS 339.88) TaxID=685588 RepID=A0A067U137_GALM3|nr:hypothetical protein GALMADRAFT_219029 [Galerina marginata CBS 339.88]
MSLLFILFIRGHCCLRFFKLSVCQKAAKLLLLAGVWGVATSSAIEAASDLDGQADYSSSMRRCSPCLSNWRLYN